MSGVQGPKDKKDTEMGTFSKEPLEETPKAVQKTDKVSRGFFSTSLQWLLRTIRGFGSKKKVEVAEAKAKSPSVDEKEKNILDFFRYGRYELLFCFKQDPKFILQLIAENEVLLPLVRARKKEFIEFLRQNQELEAAQFLTDLCAAENPKDFVTRDNSKKFLSTLPEAYYFKSYVEDFHKIDNDLSLQPCAFMARLLLHWNLLEQIIDSQQKLIDDRLNMLLFYVPKEERYELSRLKRFAIEERRQRQLDEKLNVPQDERRVVLTEDQRKRLEALNKLQNIKSLDKNTFRIIQTFRQEMQKINCSVEDFVSFVRDFFQVSDKRAFLSAELKKGGSSTINKILSSVEIDQLKRVWSLSL